MITYSVILYSERRNESFQTIPGGGENGTVSISLSFIGSEDFLSANLLHVLIVFLRGVILP